MTRISSSQASSGASGLAPIPRGTLKPISGQEEGQPEKTGTRSRKIGARSAAHRELPRYDNLGIWRDKAERSCFDAIALSASEVALLRRLVYPSRLDHLEAVSISRSIDDIVVEVSRSSTSRSGTYILCFTQGSGLGEAVYDETEGEIATDDFHGQLDWIRADLDCGPRLLVPRAFDAVTTRLSLVTETMIYTLVPMREDGSVAWDVAMCTRIERRGEGFRIGETDEHDVRQPIEVVTSVRRAIDTRARLGSDALDWSGFAGASVSQPGTDRRSLIRQALVLVQIIESVINALEIYPVEILAVEIQGGNRYVVLRAEPENERDKVAKRVGLIESERALKRLFEEDQRDSEGRWRLSMAASLGASRRNDVAVSFVENSGSSRTPRLPLRNG